MPGNGYLSWGTGSGDGYHTAVCLYAYVLAGMQASCLPCLRLVETLTGAMYNISRPRPSARPARRSDEFSWACENPCWLSARCEDYW